MGSQLGKRERVAGKSRKRRTIEFYCSQRSEWITLKLGSKKRKSFMNGSSFSESEHEPGGCGRCRKIKAKACARDSTVGLLATPSCVMNYCPLKKEVLF